MTTSKSSQTKKTKKSEQEVPQKKKANNRTSCQTQSFEYSDRWQWLDWLVFCAAILFSILVFGAASYIWYKKIYSDSLISLALGVTSIMLAIWSIYFSWRSNRKTSVTLFGIQHNVDELIQANSTLSNTVLTWQKTMDLQVAKQNVRTFDIQKKTFEYGASDLPTALVLYACKKVKENGFFISFNEIHPAIASLAYEFLNNIKNIQPSIFECEFNNRGIISVKIFDKDYFKNIDQYKITTRAKNDDVSPNIRSIINEGITKINQYYQK